MIGTLLKFFALQRTGGSRTGRLVRHYFITSLLLVSSGLIVGGLVQMYYSHEEARGHIALLQQEKADGAAFRIEQFIANIEQGLRTAAASRDLVVDGVGPRFQIELDRLLHILPPITDVVAIDLSGRNAVYASRFKAVPMGDSQNQAAQQALLAFQSDSKRDRYIGPIDFIRDSEPYLHLAVPIELHAGRLLGVLFAVVDLRYVADVVGAIAIGRQGYAYVVTGAGELVAHPDISVVLQRRNVANYSQVKAAFDNASKGAPRRMQTATGLRGESVFSSFAPIPRLGWSVIVEQPAAELYATIYGALARTAGLILLGFCSALWASFHVARHVLRPLMQLRSGVDRIGRGDLDHRLEVSTGDEIEMLADEFNKMTDALKQSYSGLESRVSERTQELRVANDRLQELDRLKSQFVSNVSHELRTPLTVIRSLVDNMRDGLTGELNEKQQFYLTGIRSSSDRLSRLIRDLLDLSVIQSGKLKLNPSKFSLSTLVHEITEGLRLTAKEKNIDLELDQLADIKAYADRDKIAQILTNLLGNAIKFTPEEGRIEVSAAVMNEAWAKVTILDTGPGIAASDAEAIFVEFSQVARPGREKSHGVGLGLAISKKLVEMYGGQIGLLSRPLGSEFYFTVPTCELGNVGTPPNESTL